jgi:hypothetical protein
VDRLRLSFLNQWVELITGILLGVMITTTTATAEVWSICICRGTTSDKDLTCKIDR